MVRTTARHLLGVACLVVVLLGGYLVSLWPQGRGMVRLERLPGPAAIVRDELGVPCIWGSSHRAAFFAMGYAHAQDRLWQLELMRRAAWGELAPLVGDGALPLDALHRRLGFYRQALVIRSILGEEGELLRAYAHGISAYLRAHPARLPPQFLLARLRPALWQPEDVLAIGAMVEWYALPCSLRIRGHSSETAVDGRRGARSSPPVGSRAFLRPIVVATRQSGDTTLCAMTWGSHPYAWIETGMVGPRGLRRGWSIPGWPVPHAVATVQGLATITAAADDPWRVEDVDGWAIVDEYLHDSPDGPRDSVRVSGRSSAVAPIQAGARDWWVTEGSSRFAAWAIRRGLGGWIDVLPQDGDDGDVYRWYGPSVSAAESLTTVSLVPNPAETVLEPPVSFGLLDRLARVTGVVRGPMVGAHCQGPFLAGGTAPVSVMVQWAAGTIRGALLWGQSEVIGNTHRRDQHPAWSRGRLIPRDMRLPDYSRGCALVPVLPHAEQASRATVVRH